MPLTGWPTYADDDGTGQSGTVGDVAFFDDIEAALEAYIVDPNNPTVTPADIIDEVVTARGVEASVDARLDAIEAGGIAIPAGAVTVAQAQSLLRVNLTSNDLFDVWPDGSSGNVAPACWTKTGAGSTCERTGSAAYGESALSDTRRKVGRFANKFTRAGTNCYLTQELLDSSIWAVVDNFETRTFGFGVWAWSAVASAASIILQADSPGVLIQRGQYIDDDAGSYHPGDSAWHWLSGTYTIPSTATELKLKLAMESSDGAVYWAAPGVCLSDIRPKAELVSHQVLSSYFMYVPATLVAAAATTLHLFELSRPGVFDFVRLNCLTAPVGADLVTDLETGDGTTFNSMFTAAGTRPTIADGAKRGGARPDAAYAYRCMRGDADGAAAAGSMARFAIDQVGSGTAGADLFIRAQLRQYANPLEAYRLYNDLG